MTASPPRSDKQNSRDDEQRQQRFGGRALALRLGRYVRLTDERLDKAEAFFNHHGTWIIMVARCMPCNL